MNSCVLLAKIIRNPELRYTQDNQTPVTQMLVEFEGSRPEDPPSTLKVVGWGTLASEIQENYSEGDRLIIEGRLSMYSFDRPEGFKEKRAELIVSRLHRLDGSVTPSVPASDSTSSSEPNNLESINNYQQTKDEIVTSVASPSTAVAAAPTESEPGDPNLDDIPF